MDTVFLVLRVVVSLGAVFGALFMGHRWITKGRTGAARTKQIAVVARQGLGAKAGVAIVDAHGRRYLLGVTEHAVTVLDTLGPTPEEGVQVVSTAPVPVPSFERELQTVTLLTGAVPVLVHGGTAPGAPDGPITRALVITSATAVVEPVHLTRRAVREAQQSALTTPPQPGGVLAGSVLSPQTWKQTVAALKQLR